MRSDHRRAVRAMVFLALLSAGSLLVPDRADAVRRFVPKQHPTLQDAIDAAAPGDTIWVSAGVYRGPFTMRKPLLLFGDAGPDSTILDGGGSDRVIHVEGVNGGAIVGFGIRGGKAVAGGGVYAVRDTNFSVDYCHFTKNWESGLSIWQSEAIKVANCRFTENQGSALQFHQSTGFILSCEFHRNKGNGGGAIYFDRSEISVFRQCRFEDNRAETTMGGAVLADSSRLGITGCTFLRNSSAVAGGAVAMANHSFLTIARCEFTENHAAQAGALHGDASQLLVGFCVFDRNRATAGGAAVAMVGRYDANVNQTITSNTFYKNTTNGSGATLFSVKTSPEIVKNIFVVEGKEQLATSGVQSSPRYECNLIHDPTGVALGRLPSSDTLVGDPMFCDPAKGKFELRDLSPALRSTCGQVGARPRGCDTFRLQPSR